MRMQGLYCACEECCGSVGRRLRSGECRGRGEAPRGPGPADRRPSRRSRRPWGPPRRPTPRHAPPPRRRLPWRPAPGHPPALRRRVCVEAAQGSCTSTALALRPSAAKQWPRCLTHMPSAPLLADCRVWWYMMQAAWNAAPEKECRPWGMQAGQPSPAV